VGWFRAVRGAVVGRSGTLRGPRSIVVVMVVVTPGMTPVGAIIDVDAVVHGGRIAVGGTPRKSKRQKTRHEEEY
jgi:hypothetical protein